jgi:cation:H+ antiporter
MTFDFALLLGGLILLIKGGDWFVASTIRIAEFLQMPRIVIGSTLVSLATTMPEFSVSVFSGVEGEAGLAVGNAIGSCICNIALIIGLAATINQVDLKLSLIKLPWMAMAGLALLLLVFTLNLKLVAWKGWILIALGAAYFGFDFVKNLRRPREGQRAEEMEIKEEISSGPRWLRSRWATGGQFLLGATTIALGSHLLVEGAVGIAKTWHVPPILVGLSVISIGTSLPELMTAITASRKRVSDLAIGNVLGANIANLSFVIGTAAVLHDVNMSRTTQLFNFPMLLVVMTMFFLFIKFGSRITRKEGALLLGFYALYLACLIAIGIRTAGN